MMPDEVYHSLGELYLNCNMHMGNSSDRDRGENLSRTCIHMPIFTYLFPLTRQFFDL